MDKEKHQQERARPGEAEEGKRLAWVRIICSGGVEGAEKLLETAAAEEPEPRVRCLASIAASAVREGNAALFPSTAAKCLVHFRALLPEARHGLLESAAVPGGLDLAGFVLAALLEDDNPLVWLRALKTMGACCGSDFLPWVAVFLDAPQPRTVRAALLAMGASGRGEGIYYIPSVRHLDHHIVDHALVAYIESLDPQSLCRAVEGIPGIVVSGFPEGAPLNREMARILLDRIIQQTSGAVFECAVETLARMGLKSLDSDLQIPRRIRPPGNSPFNGPSDPKAVSAMIISASKVNYRSAFEAATTLFELESHIESNRLNALSLIEENGTMEALEPVRLSTHDRSRSVRFKATKVFVNLKRRLDQPISRIGNAEDPALAILCGVLDSGGRKGKVAALRAADLSIPGLLELILLRLPTEKDEHARAMMCTMAGMLGGTMVAPVLVPLLKDPDDRVRANAVEGLIYTGDPAAFRQVIPMLRDGNQRVQLNIQNALKTLDPDSAMKLLTELAYSAEESHRLFSAYTLGLIGHSNTIIFVGLLKGMLIRESSPRVMVRIVKSFVKIYSRYPTHIGRSALEKFMEGITDPIKRKALNIAIEALGMEEGAVMEERKWYDAVEEPLDPSLAFTRIINGTMSDPLIPAPAEAVVPDHKAVQRSGPVAAAGIFIEFEEDAPHSKDSGDTEEDFAWASTLMTHEEAGDTEKERLFDALAANLESPDPSVRGSALDSLRVLKELPPRLIDKIKPLVGDSDPMVRYRAFRAMKTSAPEILAEMDSKALRGAGFSRVSFEVETKPTTAACFIETKPTDPPVKIIQASVEKSLVPMVENPPEPPADEPPEPPVEMPPGEKMEAGEKPASPTTPSKGSPIPSNGARKSVRLALAAAVIMLLLTGGSWLKDLVVQRILAAKLVEARIEFLAGRKYEALDLYLAAREADENSVEALSGLAKCLYYTGRSSEAERAVDMIGRIDRESPWYIDFIALGNLLEGRIDQATEEYSRALSKDSGFTAARYGLALALKGGGFIEKAAEEAARVLAEEPGHTDALVLLAEIALSRGMTGEARVLLDKVLSVNPDHPQALRFLGLVHYKEGNFVVAIGRLERAALVYAARGWPSSDIEYALGSAFLASGQNKEAIRILKALVSKQPGDNESRLNLAAALGRSGDVEGEKEQYREILSHDSANPKPFYNLGIIYYNEGDMEASKKMFLQAVKLDPLMADGFFNIGVLNHRVGNLEEARKFYRRTLEISPGHPGASLGLKGVGG